MKIGIDARILAHPVTGIGRYTAELTSQLLKLESEYFLYSASPILVGDWEERNVTLRAARIRSRAGRMLWSQTYLPYWAKKDRVDVFWGTSHRLPRYLPSSVARVVTIHDLVWKYAGKTMRPVSYILERRLMPEALRLADRIVVDSNSTANDLKKEFPETSDRIRVVYPGVTSFPSNQGKEILVSLGIIKPYILFVGTLEPRKNLHRLLQAYGRLNSDLRLENQLVIAGGDGWGGVDVTQLVRQYNIEDQVVITGYVSDEALSVLYSGAKLLAMPSLYEGFGLPLIEAMAQGTPVLTSNSSSMPEVAGDAGFFVNPLDVDSIASGLSSLLNDHEALRRMSVKALQRSTLFSWEAAAIKMINILNEAVEARSAG